MLSAASCGGEDELIIGVATSVRDTGLMDELVREFKERDSSAGTVKPVAAASGRLVELARRGEVDVIISHSPEAEAALLAEDEAIDRRPFMHNFFVIVGPGDDPAGVAAAGSLRRGFELIAEEEAQFVSRGDRSGTHVRELATWEDAGINPTDRPWYQESGAGQGAGLLVASDKDAYTLVDGGTWAVLEERTELSLLFEDGDVPNVYTVMRMNPEKHDVSEEAARAFADFLTSPAGQNVIGEFGRGEYDEPLFMPGVPAPD